MEYEKLSKIISHALRHKPEDYGLNLSEDGWVSIDELVRGIKSKEGDYINLTRQHIIDLVDMARKKRHQVLNGNIRALHGHSIQVEVVERPLSPPDKLYHATAFKYWDEIKEKGLKPMSRKYVHLAVHKQDAVEIAIKKYQKTLLLQIDALNAYEKGVLFYSNVQESIWMTKYIPPQYISIAIEG
jgi:putative RNA 2'-phosphotransferase